MKLKTYLKVFLSFILILGLAATLPAFNLILGLHGHVGVTVVDVGTATGWGDDVDEWDTFFFGFFAQGFYQINKLYVGLELGYNRLYYYFARVPYAYPSTLTYEGTSAPMKGLVVAQYELTKSVFAQVGAGLHFFDDPAIGFMGSIRYHLNVTDKIQVPIFARADLIAGDGTPIVLSAGVGVVIFLKAGK